jgi:hypothetical protein
MKNFTAILLLVLNHFFFAHGQSQRCGTPSPSQTVPANALFKITASTVTIPVIVHVVYASSGTGNISDSQVRAQVDTLNATFTRAGTKYRFYLAGVSRTQNDNWHNAGLGSQAVLDMTNALAVDTKHALNIYVINAGLYAGWVIRWPWEVSESSPHHGVVVHYGSVPGGHITNFNYGYTATHEAGHYLGLYHTFQNGCTPPGDEVDDTPYHLENYGCPTPNPDTCPQSGLDPIHNYMNYTNDPCYREFTSGQGSRMDAIVGQYKPSLGGTTLYFSSNFSIPAGRYWRFFNSTLSFASGVSISVYGTLDASSCTFTAPSTSTWSGILFNSGSSGTINYCTVSKVHKFGGGAVTVVTATVRIDNSTIENNTGICNGVNITDRANGSSIWRTTIRNNSGHGVYIYNSSPFLKYNNITGNTNTGNAAVYSSYYSGPVLGDNAPPIEGKNTLTGGYYGIAADFNCNVVAGSTSTGGDNRYFGNSYANAFASNSSTITARYAWWGQSPPDASKIIASSGSVIYYDPWLTSDPGPAFRMQGPSPPVLMPALSMQTVQPSTTDSRMLLLQAREERFRNNHAAAISIYQGIITSAPASNEAKIAFIELGNVYQEVRDKGVREYIESFSKARNPFRATALEILSNCYRLDGNLVQALAVNNSLISDFAGTTHEKHGRLNLFFIYYGSKQYSPAREQLTTLRARYSNEEIVLTASWLMEVVDGRITESSATHKQVVQPSEPAEEKQVSLIAYPNPFNPATVIYFTIPEAGFVSLKVFDLLGREIAVLVHEYHHAGSHEVLFNAINLSSGIYFYRLETGANSIVRKFLLTK